MEPAPQAAQSSHVMTETPVPMTHALRAWVVPTHPTTSPVMMAMTAPKVTHVLAVHAKVWAL